MNEKEEKTTKELTQATEQEISVGRVDLRGAAAEIEVLNDEAAADGLEQFVAEAGVQDLGQGADLLAASDDLNVTSAVASSISARDLEDAIGLDVFRREDRSWHPMTATTLQSLGLGRCGNVAEPAPLGHSRLRTTCESGVLIGTRDTCFCKSHPAPGAPTRNSVSVSGPALRFPEFCLWSGEGGLASSLHRIQGEMLMVQRTWRSMWLIFLVAVLLTLATGCRTAEPEPTPSPTEAVATAEAAVEEFVTAYPLAATAWDLEYFGPPEQRLSVLPDTRATVAYFWDRYAGFDGCNWFLGVYSATTEGELRNQTPSRTRNVCGPEELYQQSGMYVSSLLNVTEYRLEGEQLIENTVDDQRLLTFNPAKPVPMPGTEWGLALWWRADDKMWYPVVPTSRTTITFGEEGEASGSGGCNSYTVSYEGDLQIEKVMEATDTYAELPTLTFGPVAAQFVACEEPEGIMDQEQGYFTVLSSVAYYFKLGGMLMMLDVEGNPLLIFGAYH